MNRYQQKQLEHLLADWSHEAELGTELGGEYCDGSSAASNMLFKA